jgi:hypothetical protein
MYIELFGKTLKEIFFLGVMQSKLGLAYHDEKAYSTLCRFLALHLVLEATKKDSWVEGNVHDWSVYHYKHSTVLLDAVHKIHIDNRPHYELFHIQVQSSDPAQEELILSELEALVQKATPTSKV